MGLWIPFYSDLWSSSACSQPIPKLEARASRTSTVAPCSWVGIGLSQRTGPGHGLASPGPWALCTSLPASGWSRAERERDREREREGKGGEGAIEKEVCHACHRRPLPAKQTGTVLQVWPLPAHTDSCDYSTCPLKTGPAFTSIPIPSQSYRTPVIPHTLCSHSEAGFHVPLGHAEDQVGFFLHVSVGFFSLFLSVKAKL